MSSTDQTLSSSLPALSGYTPTASKTSPLASLSTPSVATFSGRPIVIIGAGTIGRLLATEALLGGRNVHLIDQSSAALETSRAALQTSINSELREPDAQQRAFSRLTLTAGDLRSDEKIHAALQVAACVIEALPENKELKEEILGSLDVLVPHTTSITTVSSSFPVRELLQKATFKERFINTHPLQRGIAAVEVMPSANTSSQTHREVSSLFQAIGMVPVDVQKENVGFIFNIVWRNIKKTTLELVEKGVNTPQDFDRIWMMALKTRVGPFGLMDMVGLDVVLAIEERYAKLSGQDDDLPPRFLRAMVERGELGVKSGRGFYAYPDPQYKRPGFLERGANTGSAPLQPTRDTLLGAWDLVSFTATKAGSDVISHPMGENVKGSLLYSIDGSMSVALIKPNRAAFSSSDPLGGTIQERAAAYSEYFGYVGAFRYRNGIVYHDVEHCSYPNWSGSSLLRFASLDEQGLLTLSTHPVEIGGSIGVQRLVWRRKG